MDAKKCKRDGAGLDPAIHKIAKRAEQDVDARVEPAHYGFSNRRRRMAEILGLGCTHRPVMLRRNEDWTGMMRTSLDDPDMPEEMKDPARWPAQLREELGNDWGTAAAERAREIYRRHFAETRAA